MKRSKREKEKRKRKDYMIEKNDKVNIQENFLVEEEFIGLRDHITDITFPWFFHDFLVKSNEGPLTPGWFAHKVYTSNMPTSSFYQTYFNSILEQLDCAVLSRIRVNLNPRLPEPYFGVFHSDTEDLDEAIAPQWIVSILYINTNNGYTELEDGTKIESVANRLVSFPGDTRHRLVTQTDEQTRIAINFNYAKLKTGLHGFQAEK